MKNVIAETKEQIITTVKNAVANLASELPVDAVLIENACKVEIEAEIPKDKTHGDFSTNIAMKLTKVLKNSPVNIANALIKVMNTEGTYIEKVEIAGPGFINFYLTKKRIYDALKSAYELGDEFGRLDVGKGKKVMVEFVSANPTGPMHMGNARGGALGDSLASVLDMAGYDVTREFYINDAGAQIEKFANSLEARYIQALKGEDAVEFSDDWYQGNDIKVHAANFIELFGDKYLECSSEERKDALVAYGLEKNIAKLKSDLSDYRINYDVWFNESKIHENGEVAETIELLRKSDLTYEKDGALWFKSTEFGSEKDDVLIRANGFPTYFAVDIAYHRNKFEKRGFDKVINIWGADHHGHVARMKGAMDAIGCDGSKLDIIIMQLVRLVKQGEAVRMSKRTGEMITLSDLVEDIGIDAARFFFNLRQAGSHLEFDLDLAIAQNNDNPVFYVQYAHARIASIIRNLAEEGTKLADINDIDLELLKEDAEIELIEKIISYPNEIYLSSVSMEPSKLTRYVMDLSALFHSFYNSCRVKCDDEKLMQARLMLCHTTKNIIKNVFAILKIDAPEKM
ncbi:MAG: arginine--tRNA ligase [Ruminococcaceae bacterium]|nr:arginine--tRNA ligase [Oscillospiraceae bacterium]